MCDAPSTAQDGMRLRTGRVQGSIHDGFLSPEQVETVLADPEQVEHLPDLVARELMHRHNLTGLRVAGSKLLIAGASRGGMNMEAGIDTRRMECSRSLVFRL